MAMRLKLVLFRKKKNLLMVTCYPTDNIFLNSLLNLCKNRKRKGSVNSGSLCIGIGTHICQVLDGACVLLGL